MCSITAMKFGKHTSVAPAHSKLNGPAFSYEYITKNLISQPKHMPLVQFCLSKPVLFCLFVCLFDLFILNVPSTIFQLYRDGYSWVEPVLSYDKCVLPKDHNAVTPVRLEPAALWSSVKHSTTEPLHSLNLCCNSTQDSVFRTVLY